jgi:hypothetical protein
LFAYSTTKAARLWPLRTLGMLDYFLCVASSIAFSSSASSVFEIAILT